MHTLFLANFATYTNVVSMRKVWINLPFGLSATTLPPIFLIAVFFFYCKPEINQNLTGTAWVVDSIAISGSTKNDYGPWIESMRNTTLELLDDEKYRLTNSEGPQEGVWKKTNQHLKIGEDQFEIVSLESERLNLKQEVPEEKIAFLFFLRKKANVPS